MPIRIQFFRLDRESCEFWSNNFFGQKSVFTLNYKFLQTLIYTEKTRESIINAYKVFCRFSVFFYRQVHFSNNLNNFFHKKSTWTYCCSSSIGYKKKKTDWILRIFIFNHKNPLYLPIISTNHFSFFWGSK